MCIEPEVVPMKHLARKLKDSGVDTSKISLEKAIEFYEESRKLEWKRLSMTQQAYGLLKKRQS